MFSLNNLENRESIKILFEQWTKCPKFVIKKTKFWENNILYFLTVKNVCQHQKQLLMQVGNWRIYYLQSSSTYLSMQREKKKNIDKLNYNFNSSLTNAQGKTSLKMVCVLWKKLKFLGCIWFMWNMKTAKLACRFPGTATIFLLVYIF